eukprot:scaffold19044_cov97-Phaeocystis_antarctica.AAC.1
MWHSRIERARRKAVAEIDRGCTEVQPCIQRETLLTPALTQVAHSRIERARRKADAEDRQRPHRSAALQRETRLTRQHRSMAKRRIERAWRKPTPR